jgi:hypothetical protein
MNQEAIFSPMAALVGLTFLVLLQVPIRRFRAAFAGHVNAEDFKYGESERVPQAVTIPNRNLMNLLEMPVLFYVACFAQYVTETVVPAALWLAWIYVGLRVVHSIVHLTYNRVPHRLVAFAVSNVVLGTIWARWLFAFYRG